MKRVMYLVVFVAAASLLLTAVVSPVGAGRLAQPGAVTGTPDANGTGIPQTGSQNAAGPAFLNLQTLQSFKVQDITGNALGNVSDFVINLARTRIDYLVMNANNGRQVLVPWSSLSAIDAQSRTFTFKDPGSRLENAPTFDASGLDFSDPNWSQSTVNYWRFGVGGVNNPSNSGAGQGQSATAQPTAGTSGSPDQSATAEPTRQAQTAQNGTAGQSSGNTSRGNGAVAVLASRLLNAQVIDIANTSFGSNAATNSQLNSPSNSTGSSSSGSAQATPMATEQGVQSTSVPNTGSSSSSNQGSNGSTNGQFNSSDVLGTVAGAIITRINGDIRYILVQPQGALAESIRQASLNAQNQNSQGTSVPNTGSSPSGNSSSSSQSGTAQPTDTSNNSGSGPVAQSTAQATGSNAQGDVNGGVIPVPFDIMFPTVQNDNLVLRASPFMLRSAPVMQSNIDNLGFGWDQNINQFWGSGGLQGGRFPLFSGNNGLQAGANGGVPVTGSDQASLASAAFVQLNTLQNFDIQDGAGNSLGSIQDFVVNIPKTRIDYVVVSATDGRQVLVPWAGLSSVDTNSKVFYFRYAGSTLQNAPVFDVNTLNFNDPEWDNDTINFWITGRNAIANNSGSSSGNTSGSSNTNGSTNNGSAQATPEATSQVGQSTSVPNTGSSGQTNSNANGQSQGGPVGAVAVLASQLVGAPVYDVTAVNATGNQVGGNTANQGSSSAGNSSNPAQGTAAATGTAGSGTGNAESTGVPNTGNVQSTGVPNTGGLQGNTGSDVIGTVRGAIVTRLNGDIRYLLVEPAAGIANTGGSGQNNGQLASTEQPGANSSTQGSSGNAQNSVQTTGMPQAGEHSGSSGQSATAQSTSIPNTGNTGASGFLVPVPFSAVTTSASNGQLFLRVSPFLLRNAPSLDLNSLPEVLGFGFDQGILNFWNTGRVGSSSSQGGNATQTP